MNNYFINVKRQQLLWSLTLIATSLLLTGLLLLSVQAQDKASAKKPSPLELTLEEKSVRDAHLQELIPTRQRINTLLDQALATDDEEKALGFWSRARALYTGKLIPANDKFNAWLTSIQEAHKCRGCNLQGDILVPAQLPGQAPVPVPASSN